MQVLTDNVGVTVIKELKKAIQVQLAVAFFCPNDELLAGLSAAPRLTVIISEEFTINNPEKLKKLPKRTTIRSIPPEDGKLHAKVLIVKRRDGSQWALLGSANMTWSGMFRNQEACVTMESSDDETAIEELNEWFEVLAGNSREPDLIEAQKIFDSRSQYRLEPRPKVPKTSNVGYWALKATAGQYGESHWEQFKTEQVVAIGWQGLPVDPASVSDDELYDAYRSRYPGDSVRATQIAIRTIRAFIALKMDDIVVVCRGYSAPSGDVVYINGLARVTGKFRADPPTKAGWRFIHPAVIQPLEFELPKSDMVKAFHKQSLMLTLHKLNQAAFDRFAELLRSVGKHVDV